jgi:hypothetical protein
VLVKTAARYRNKSFLFLFSKKKCLSCDPAIPEITCGYVALRHEKA